MKQKLISIIEKYDRISEKMAEPDIVTNVEKIKELSQEQKQLEEIVIVAKAYILLLEQIEEYKELSDSDDDELKMMAEEELISSEENQIKLEDQIKVLLLPKNPHDNKNLILEIRAGTGGDEAALFAADLYRLYTRFSERNNWKLKVIQSSGTGIGGFKEIIVALEGKGAYGKLKYESGVHRVQRVPKTETSGRVHTSAATVAVMPEAKDVDVSVNEGDLKIDTYRASGAGGQHVNKTESAIRITHIPTGLVVTCQDQSSQHKNRAAALKVLKSRLLAAEQDKVAKKRAAERKSLVSTGDRSAKIRTYNFPQGRVTDHRIHFTTHRLNEILDGDIIELIEELKIAEQQELLAAEVE
ncbi:MAG: peptide chain release factor 1 [Candidatus Marinimicrobia bacterium]|nr:peptide chain release factor 1 [Candidatus Neomarinimicrobiota bacterium]MBT3497096.1 peptide chain release factor 1 [Candidatus Neomarinimicrobiota bacterium]MBT3691931.1 peptide chain release factor 1 [Candidatus Neomarinimicrobiota bacterium]MBT3732038.1 peptide chain release factor 1 [Candidatus Neomarinimicrobiota bacterium]MBT4144210.1 peptide chain release factor 1 [Candidatus Neomarinimicrobiota bacterium]